MNTSGDVGYYLKYTLLQCDHPYLKGKVMALRRKNKRWKKPFTCSPTQRNKTSLGMESMVAEGYSSTNTTRRAIVVGRHPYLFEVCDPLRARAIINELFGTQN